MTDQADRLAQALADRYTIERELGAGGMATVYLAQDVKHHRKVALKVLRPELAAVLGAERFVQEIETTANLQHPHILPLFDSGQGDGFLYYVMPFIDGESLRDKLNRETQLSIDEAVKITTEVADALDYAHRQSVIHRDIKPENILLHDGRPVVADFGIALAVSAAAGGRMTETGMSLGTPHYMSPEQATAKKDLTNRSDIYSLGCVLYEMLTGDPPHTGSSAQAIIMKIVTDEVRPLSELRKSVPPNVAAATEKALEKLAGDRFATGARFSEALANPSFTVQTTPASSMTGVSRRASTINWISYAVIAVLAVASLWGWLRPRPQQPVTRVSVRFPSDQARVGDGIFDMSLDGRIIVYNGPGESDEQPQLWARRWDALQATPIPSTEGANGFAVSPEGDEVAFPADSSIRIVTVENGLSRTVAPDSVNCCVRWSRDGDWIYFGNWSRGLSRVSPSGGLIEVMTIVNTARAFHTHLWLDVLPGGRGGVFQDAELYGYNSRIMSLDLETGEVHELFPGRFPRYRGGRLWFANQDGTNLITARFDAQRMEVTGQPTPVAGGLTPYFGDHNVAYYAVSQTGTLVYSSGAQEQERTPVWVSREGLARPVDPNWRGHFGTLALSPDGNQLAIDGIREDDGVFVKQLDRGPLVKLPTEGSINSRPSWTADGESVMYISNRVDNIGPYSTRSDGSGLSERTNIDAGDAFWSEDGRWIIYRTSNLAADLGNIMAIRPGLDTLPLQLVVTEYQEQQPALSPDVRWLAYSSNRSGTREVYVRPFPNAGDYRVSISIDGGSSPVWANSGRELFYKNASNELISVTFTTTPAFAVESRDPLFSTGRFVRSFVRAAYDISPDDSRFVMLELAEPSSANSRELILVENVFEELKAKAGN